MPAKSINLLPNREFETTILGKILRWSLTYGRYIIVSTEIVVLLAFIYRFSLDRKITDLKEEIDQKAAIIEANQGFETQFRNLQKRTQQIGLLFQNQDTSVKVLRHLQSITPSGVQFNSFTYSGDAVTINALVTTNSDLSLFLNDLKNSPLLTKINVTSLSKKSAGASETSLEIQAQVKSPQTVKPVSTN